MNTIVKCVAVVVLSAPLLLINQAFAATYKLPIEGGSNILKIFLDNGVARRISVNSNVAMFEVEMNGNECIASLNISFSYDVVPFRTRYDVCSEKGFGLRITRGPF